MFFSRTQDDVKVSKILEALCNDNRLQCEGPLGIM